MCVGGDEYIVLGVGDIDGVREIGREIVCIGLLGLDVGTVRFIRCYIFR